MGIHDGRWVEVTNLHRSTASGPDLPRVPVNGPERVILGDLSSLADGGPVEVAPDSAASKVADKPSGAGGGQRATPRQRSRTHRDPSLGVENAGGNDGEP